MNSVLGRALRRSLWRPCTWLRQLQYAVLVGLIKSQYSILWPSGQSWLWYNELPGNIHWKAQQLWYMYKLRVLVVFCVKCKWCFSLKDLWFGLRFISNFSRSREISYSKYTISTPQFHHWWNLGWFHIRWSHSNDSYKCSRSYHVLKPGGPVSSPRSRYQLSILRPGLVNQSQE